MAFVKFISMAAAITTLSTPTLSKILHKTSTAEASQIAAEVSAGVGSTTLENRIRNFNEQLFSLQVQKDEISLKCKQEQETLDSDIEAKMRAHAQLKVSMSDQGARSLKGQGQSAEINNSITAEQENLNKVKVDCTEERKKAEDQHEVLRKDVAENKGSYTEVKALCGDKKKASKFLFVEMSSKKRKEKIITIFEHRKKAHAYKHKHMLRKTETLETLRDNGKPCPKADLSGEKQKEGCAAIVDELHSLFMQTSHELRISGERIAEHDDSCKTTVENKQELIEELKGQQQLAENMMMDATSKITGNQSLKDNLDRDMRELESEKKTKKDACYVEMDNIEKEKCGLRAVRDALKKAESDGTPITDCEVSPWGVSPDDECMKEVDCPAAPDTWRFKKFAEEFKHRFANIGYLTREVITFPSASGMQCPPLRLRRECPGTLEMRCKPQDCALTKFSGWGECSAECGGGVKSRTRSIARSPLFGGKPCGEVSEVQNCNVESCDRDCELSEWKTEMDDSTPANPGYEKELCSASCYIPNAKRAGNPYTLKSRKIEKPAVGFGKCLAEENKSRFLYGLGSCDATLPMCPDKFLCDANKKNHVDVTLFMDGSGSTLMNKSFDSQKSFVTKFAKKVLDENSGEATDPRVKILEFGGDKAETLTSGDFGFEKTFTAVEKVLKDRKEPQKGGTDLAAALVSSGVDAGVDGIQPPELVGRKKVVVILIDGGLPVKEDLILEQANKYKEQLQAKIVVVRKTEGKATPNGRKSDEQTDGPEKKFLCDLASYPCRANLYEVEGFADKSTEDEVIPELVLSACDKGVVEADDD